MKNPVHEGGILLEKIYAESSGCFSNAAALNAIGTDQQFLDAAANCSTNALQIGEEAPGSTVVSVTYIVARHRFLTADVTDPCHFTSPFQIGLLNAKPIYREKGREARCFSRWFCHGSFSNRAADCQGSQCIAERLQQLQCFIVL
jgi:hypothetical protein